MNIDFTLAGAVIITGLVVVFVALIGLSLIVWVIGKRFVLRSIRRARERTSWAQAGMMQNTQPF